MKLHIIAKPNAKIASVAQIGENKYDVRVDAPAQQGKANERLIEILADHFNVSKSRVIVEKGHKSHYKIVNIKI